MVPLKFRWTRRYICNASYYHHQLGCINLPHWFDIYPWLCAWGGWPTITFCYFVSYHFIYINIYRLIWVFVSSFTVQSMMCANTRMNYGLMVVSLCLHITRSHYHHNADLPEGIEDDADDGCKNFRLIIRIIYHYARLLFDAIMPYLNQYRRW